MPEESAGPAAVPGFRYDVAIVGSHLATGLLGAVLARHGIRVLLLDAPGDRTEPSGDSTVPYTTAVVQLLAERFNLPEVGAFAHFTDLPVEVRRASGTKASLAFLHHRPGRKHVPEHTVQFHVPGEHNEWHLYRPAVDEHARQVAAGRGVATVAARTPVAAATVTADGVELTLADGSRYDADLLVDAGGIDSPALAGVGVPAVGDGLQLRSRLLTAQFRRVGRFEDGVRLSDYKGATPFSAGTVHHVFDGGWIQVTEFGNHPESDNRVAGVAVGLDADRYGALPADPEAAFRALVAKFPSVAEQFRDAVAVTPWTEGRPWQRRRPVTSGPRWIALERSASRTDDFLSRDVTMSVELVHALGAALLRVLHEGAEPGAELAGVAAFQDRLIDFNDRMLAAARTAGQDFLLFNAYTRVWLLWQILAHLSLKRATADAQGGASWRPVEHFDAPIWFDTPAGLTDLLDWFFDQFAQVRTGTLAPKTAARRIFKRLRKEKFVQTLYRFADPDSRYYHFTMPRRLLMLAWVKTIAPDDFKRLLSRENVTGKRAEPAPVPRPGESVPVSGRVG
jgi:FADH2 O2-dependent halogenase